MPGPFDRFNDRAKRVLALAQDEAIRFNHSYIGTEHLLMGLVREGEGVAARTLDSLGVSISKLRATVEQIVGRGASTMSPTQIVLSPHTKNVIEFAVDEARALGQGDVAPHHLLLALVREGGHTGAKVLEALDLPLDKVRAEVLSTLAQPEPRSATQYSARDFVGMGGGPFDRFNDRAKRVLAIAQEEAIRLRHNYIGTEHLLLGLLREGESVAAHVLDALGVELSKARTAVEFIIGAGDAPTAPSDITLSPRTKKVIELAIDEARKLGHRHVGPEHILLGLVREGQGIASGVIESLGVTLTTVREQVLAALGRAESATPSTSHAAQLHAVDSIGGPFDLMDEGARAVLAAAAEEARQMRHTWIGTEHVLIALASYPMAGVLNELGATLAHIRAGVSKAVPPGETDATSVTVTPRVKTLIGKAITLAAPVSDRVGAQHLLLALVDDPEGIGSQVLTRLGLTREKVREAVDRMGKG